MPNEIALSQLESMGFPRVRCEKALHATGNQDAESAMTWLFSHMEDPDIDEPLYLGGGGGDGGVGTAAAATAGGGSAGTADAEKIAQLGEMGITAPQARKALRECGGDVNRALDWVFSHPEDPGDVGEPAAAAAQQPTVEAEAYVAGSADLPARFELQSIVCHKGASIHAGHYVAFVRKEIPYADRDGLGEAEGMGEGEGEGKEEGAGGKDWVLFNDEKVVQAADVEEMKRFAYVYFFRRV